jgi:predicted MFS family arabinose efflux permease
LVAGVFAGVVWGIIAGIAGRVVAPGHHGRALTIAFAGTPIALAVGVPSGALIAGVIGWRLTFVAMAVFAAVIIVWAQVALPSMPGQDKPERIPVRRVFTVPGLVPVLITSVLYVTAHNLLYTYLAPLLALSGIGDAVSAVLLLFGVASLVGLVVTGALIDRHLRSLMIVSTAAFAAATLSLALMPFSSVAVFVSAAAWGLAFGGAASLLQTAMMTAAGTAVDAAQAVLVTGWNLGIAGGGVFGGVLLSATGPGSLAWVTLALLTAALILVIAGRFHAFPPPTTAHPPHL